MQFDVTDNFTFTVTGRNIGDRKPPVVGSSAVATAFNSGNTYPSTYDVLGRSFAVAGKLRF